MSPTEFIEMATEAVTEVMTEVATEVPVETIPEVTEAVTEGINTVVTEAMQVALTAEQFDVIAEYLSWISGFGLFFVVIALCYFVYKFFRIFF